MKTGHPRVEPSIRGFFLLRGAGNFYAVPDGLRLRVNSVEASVMPAADQPAAGKTLVRTKKAGELSIRLKVKNLLDHHDEHAGGYPMPGAQFYGGLTWRF